MERCTRCTNSNVSLNSSYVGIVQIVLPDHETVYYSNLIRQFSHFGLEFGHFAETWVSWKIPTETTMRYELSHAVLIISSNCIYFRYRIFI